ncbi:MAG: hypothetical protein FWF67_05645 [Fibromonadales bacterium]|nr:hypothetical protein [Fibromonadales bacterium]
MRYIILLLVLTSFSLAQPLSLGKPNEEKQHSSWLNLGFGFGALGSLNTSYKEQGKAFFNPSLLASIQFAELTAVTLEFDMTAPDGGLGGWVGLEQQVLKTDVTPFVEVQAGARHPGYDKREGHKFGDVFGFAGSLNGGFIFFRESSFRLRVKGGYEMIVNDCKDKSWNAEVNFFFAMGRPGLETIKVD